MGRGVSSRRLARGCCFFARTRRRDARWVFFSRRFPQGFFCMLTSPARGDTRGEFLCCVFTVCCTDIGLSGSKESLISDRPTDVDKKTLVRVSLPQECNFCASKKKRKNKMKRNASKKNKHRKMKRNASKRDERHGRSRHRPTQSFRACEVDLASRKVDNHCCLLFFARTGVKQAAITPLPLVTSALLTPL